jgi:succinoglycan biosynthesis transport protein ExoP
LRAQREVYQKQLVDQVASIRGSLAIGLEVRKKTLDSVNQQLEEARTAQRSLRSGSVDYNQVKSDYLQAKTLLEASEVSASKKRVEDIMPRRPAILWEKAEPSQAPYSPNIYLNMAIGVLVGLVVGVGLAFFIEYLDTSVKTMDDVENLLGVPVLAIVPKNVKLLHKQGGDVPDAEAYRILRTNIEFNRKSADANTISMVSGGPGEGKSTTIGNLAFICAQGGYSVLIVDADLRRPTQHKIFEMSNIIGLTNYLTTNAPLEEVIFPTAAENLYLMPSGILPADAVGILNSQRMSDMIAELKTRFDIIFFDSPPILGVSDGAVLASEVDQSIIVVQHRRFPRAMLQRVKQSIHNVGGTVLGVVLNNVDLRHDPNYAYYTSYYEYYSNTNTGATEKKSSRPAASAQPASAAGQPRKGGQNSPEY